MKPGRSPPGRPLHLPSVLSPPDSASADLTLASKRGSDSLGERVEFAERRQVRIGTIGSSADVASADRGRRRMHMSRPIE
jgi:hypothetical protein